MAIVGAEIVDDHMWLLLADAVTPSGDVVVRVDADHRSNVAQLHTDSHPQLPRLRPLSRHPRHGPQINADGTGRMDFDLSEVDNDVLRGSMPASTT